MAPAGSPSAFTSTGVSFRAKRKEIAASLRLASAFAQDGVGRDRAVDHRGLFERDDSSVEYHFYRKAIALFDQFGIRSVLGRFRIEGERAGQQRTAERFGKKTGQWMKSQADTYLLSILENLRQRTSGR